MDDHEEVIRIACTRCGLRFQSYTKVAGGDISHAFKVDTRNRLCFLKINKTNTYPTIFQREAEGLLALREKSIIKVPEVIANGEEENWQWLVMEWLQKASPLSNFWQQFGNGIANLHKYTNATFGWENDNYIGSLHQSNQPNHNWADFYMHQRIMSLVRKLFNDSSFSKKEVEAAESVCRKFENIFPNEPPALLHGDLWSGNYMVTTNGMPAVFDPAVYYGHREMDIAMTKLFGGFDSRFYDHYNEIYPLEKDWKIRLPVTQLYPLLVHALLFGGNYIRQCRNIISDWK